MYAVLNWFRCATEGCWPFVHHFFVFCSRTQHYVSAGRRHQVIIIYVRLITRSSSRAVPARGSHQRNKTKAAIRGRARIGLVLCLPGARATSFELPSAFSSPPPHSQRLQNGSSMASSKRPGRRVRDEAYWLRRAPADRPQAWFVSCCRGSRRLQACCGPAVAVFGLLFPLQHFVSILFNLEDSRNTQLSHAAVQTKTQKFLVQA